MSKKRESLKGKGASIFLDDQKGNSGNLEKNNTVKPVKRKTSKPKKKNTIKTVDYSYVSPGEQIKVTYFISDSIVDKLEEVSFLLKRKFKNKRINKSKLVEIAINNLAIDWEKNKESSLIEKMAKDGIK